jgi:hypothetical protein
MSVWRNDYLQRAVHSRCFNNGLSPSLVVHACMHAHVCVVRRGSLERAVHNMYRQPGPTFA